MKLIYGIKDRPKFGQVIVFAIQQLLAIMAATLVVPVIINTSGSMPPFAPQMSSAAALFGAGIGTLVYQLFTRFKSPVFLGSSFAFIGSMCAAFAGAVSAQAGYLGLIIGAAFAGLVYVLIAVIVKFAGVKWIAKLMPAVVIGPTVAIICGLVTLAVTMLCATFGKKMIRLIPFIMGILAGYAVAAIFTVIGNTAGIDALKVINFAPITDLFSTITLETFISAPEFTFKEAIHGIKGIDFDYIQTLFWAYVPVAFVVFAEHIADHKNLSTIIEKDLLEEPGLHNTLLGDGVGSIAGSIFGGCPNTTYGESVGCVAITGNASVITITTTAFMAIAISFLSPFVAFVNTIPSCVMGGVCMALYGFIAVSGLKMIQKVDLEQNRNLFVVSVILITGIGGLTVSFGKVTLTTIACALILGILTNLMLGIKDKKKDEE